MRVDTTVVETNIHYPTDSSLLGDGVRVLTRTMKRIAKIAGKAGAKLRDRSRSVKLRVKLPRFRGHPTVWVFGVHNGKEALTLRAGIPPADD